MTKNIFANVKPTDPHFLAGASSGFARNEHPKKIGQDSHSVIERTLMQPELK